MLARLYQLFKFRSFVFRQLNVCMLAHARSMAEDEENNNLFVYGALVVGLTQKLGLDNLASARRFLNAKLDAALFAYS
jgi:hypothetical protein